MTDEEDDSPIYDALTDAVAAVGEWDMARQMHAEGVRQFQQDNVRAHRIRAQVAVLRVAEHMRPYLIDDYETAWEPDTDFDKDDPLCIFPGSSDHPPVTGIKSLLSFQGQVKHERVTVDTVNGRESRIKSEAHLLPPEAIREGLSWVSQSAYELGFVPSHSKRRQLGNISTDDPDEADRIFDPEYNPLEDEERGNA
jgi:hypothetical protein